MKRHPGKLMLLATAAFFSLALTMRAGTFADNFDTSHNYLSQGLPGTGWDGMSIGFLTLPPADVSIWNADHVSANSLTISTAGGSQVDSGDSPFMWKTVTGDFTNIVHVAGYNNNIYQIVGLLAKDPNPLNGNWIYLGYFEHPSDWALTWDVRDTTGLTSTEYAGMPSYVVPGDVSTYPRWLKLVRVDTTNIVCSVSTNGTDWDDVYATSRTDFPATMQVGIFDSTYDTSVCSAQLDNFSLSGPNVETSTPPAQVSGLVLTTNSDGTYGLSWTAGAGSDGSVVVMRNGPIIRQPLDGVQYTGNAAFGSGDSLDTYEAAHNYVVYSGAGTSVTVSGLNPGSLYDLAVYSYSGSGASTVYNLVNPPTAATPVQTLTLNLPSTNLYIRPTIPHPIEQADVVAGYGTDTNDVTLDPGTVYASSSPTVATVSGTGLITAVAAGDADITTTYGGVNATQLVHVVNSASLAVNTNTLFLAALTDVLPDSGDAGNWTNLVPADHVMTPMGSPVPTVQNFGGAKFERNVYANANGYFFADYTGSNAIPVNGVSFVAAVRPSAGPNDGNRGEIVDAFYDQAGFGVEHDNQQIVLARNNGYFNWEGTACYIPTNQVTVVSLTINPNGSYELYTNGLLAVTGAAAGSGMTTLTPGTDSRAYANYINVGKNDPDGWTAFNGYLGDVYFYTNVLSQEDRIALENNLISKFITSATNSYTITASAGAGGLITPTGDVSVLRGEDQTFSFTPDNGYAVQDVVVDGASIGLAFNYTFKNVNTNHTIAVSFAPVYNVVIDASAGMGGGISPSGLATNLNNTTPTYTITTDTGYQIADVLVNGVSQGEISSYTFASLSSNQTISVSFTPVGWPLPKANQLILAAVTDDFIHSNGAAIGNWPTYVPASGPSPTNMTTTLGVAPTVALVGGENYFHSDYSVGNAGFQYYPGSGYTNTIAGSGATVIAVVVPYTGSAGNDYWDSVLSVFSGQFGIGVNNSSGEINVSRNNIGAPAMATGVYLPYGQITVLSLVMQSSGNFILYTNGVAALTNTDNSPFTLTPGAGTDWQERICVGRRNQYDGWTTENGDIGDVFLYRTALSDADRQLVEAHLMSKFIYSATNIWTITASAVGDGTIAPSGATSVNQGNDQSYTIAANPGSYLSGVTVDGVSVGPVSGYTFSAVNADHTIAASFATGTGPSLSSSFSSGSLDLSWPYGWVLQYQTNANTAGLSVDPAAWQDVPGSSSVTNMSFGPNAADNEFFRLRSP